MMSRTICGPAAVNSCDPTLNRPATLWSSFTSSGALEGVSTSSSIISLSLAGKCWSFLKFTCAAADGCVEVREAFARENVCESFVDFLCDVWSLVDEAGVQLY